MVVVETPTANVEDIQDLGSICELGRFPGGSHGNSLQYFCLGNPTDRGAWQAIVHRVTKTWIHLKQLNTLPNNISCSKKKILNNNRRREAKLLKISCQRKRETKEKKSFFPLRFLQLE